MHLNTSDGAEKALAATQELRARVRAAASGIPVSAHQSDNGGSMNEVTIELDDGTVAHWFNVPNELVDQIEALIGRSPDSMRA